MANFSDLHNDICLETGGCPMAAIDRALSQTLRHFCRATWYWSYDMAPVTLVKFIESVPSTYLYSLDCPSEVDVLAVDELVYGQRILLPQSDQWLDEHFPSWRSHDGEPRYFIQLSDRRVRLVPASDRVRPGVMRGRLVLAPTRKAKTFGDVLLDYDSGLVKGTLARLLTMNKPWADPPRAGSAQLEYLDAVSDAKQKVMTRFSQGAETIKKRRWL